MLLAPLPAHEEAHQAEVDHRLQRRRGEGEEQVPPRPGAPEVQQAGQAGGVGVLFKLPDLFAAAAAVGAGFVHRHPRPRSLRI